MLPLTPSEAQVVFEQDVAPIIYGHCATCHREDGAGPFSLTSFDEVFYRKRMILDVIESGYMPPWYPDPDFSGLKGERELSNKEVLLIRQWVESGGARGDTSDLFPLPAFSDLSVLGKPDTVLTMDTVFEYPGNNEEIFMAYVFQTNYEHDMPLSAIEFVPGNQRLIHHALMMIDTIGYGRGKDSLSREYGFHTDGLQDYPLVWLQGYLPGVTTEFFPEGMGFTLPAGADILVEIHYTARPTRETDRSSINLFFADRPHERELFTDVVFEKHIIHPPFLIPADSVCRFHSVYEVPYDMVLYRVAPHMHYRGKSCVAYAETADGEQVPLISIPHWDFNWQGIYSLQEPVYLASGSRIHYLTEFDNTAANPSNPILPPVDIGYGPRSVDEMCQMVLQFYFVYDRSYYKKSDERAE